MPGWVPVVGVAVVALILGYLFARLRSGGQGTAPTRAEAGSGNQARDLQKSIARLESDNQALTNLFQMLPEYTKKMSSRIDRREIPMHVIKVIEQMFAPTQILIFLLEERLGKMALVKQMGLPPDFPKTFLIAPGEGRIGWVAQSGMAMDTDDFIREKRLGANFEVPAHFPFRIELCAPMMHEDKVRGVISVGGITRHYKHEKSILGLIADQGSIALYNHDLFTKTQEMANCDGLTKLFNKRFFLEKLSTVILEAAKGHHPFSVFIFDLDHFKHYNDTQGHQAGDEVLRTTGELVKSALRPDDFAARYGGEEFIVLLAHAPKEGAMEAAERIRALIADHPYANRESQPLKRVSLSGGVATYPDDGLTSADLIAAADSALYRAKKASRNKVFASEPKYFSDETEDPVYNVQNG
ncbi:MAG TPA: sensor domain-containing diguanylate cyclase [Candidatus Polarisedimenticolia bacterium]|nr:sensor domain-containing diguanylate cyclase [Candidatus Polarisedimenticolia bacterium]